VGGEAPGDSRAPGIAGQHALQTEQSDHAQRKEHDAEGLEPVIEAQQDPIAEKHGVRDGELFSKEEQSRDGQEVAEEHEDRDQQDAGIRVVPLGEDEQAGNDHVGPEQVHRAKWQWLPAGPRS
jgi:hypothetical protein